MFESEDEFFNEYDKQFNRPIYTEDVIIKNIRKEGWTCEEYTLSKNASKRLKAIKHDPNNIDPKIIAGTHHYIVYIKRENLFGIIEENHL